MKRNTMNKFLISKDKAAISLHNFLFRQLKGFKKTVTDSRLLICSTDTYFMSGFDFARRGSVQLFYNIETGYTVEVTCFHTYSGQASRVFTYIPTLAEIKHLFDLAFEYSQMNSDASYSRAEKSYTNS
jgi:hypothetical protein